MENTQLLKEPVLRSLRITLISLFLIVISGCSIYSNISGTVVDEVSEKPLEGALVVAQWTQPHGFGFSYHSLHKITETLTDKEGVFFISGTIGWDLDPPVMIIYKEGYLPWRNDGVFMARSNKHNEWKNNATYKLGIFSDKYTALQLDGFLDAGMMGSGDQNVPIFSKIINDLSRKVQVEVNAEKKQEELSKKGKNNVQ